MAMAEASEPETNYPAWTDYRMLVGLQVER